MNPDYFSQVYFMFYRNSFFDAWGPLQGSKNIFCNVSIQSPYSSIELSVLITNMIFFSNFVE